MGQQGLYDKFIVRRTDGRDGINERHQHCRYFVLDLTHDPYAIKAIESYADQCRDTNPQLATDLLKAANS